MDTGDIVEITAIVSGSSVDRPDCPYGAKCYRQNPQHFQEYSHPENHQRHQVGMDGPEQGNVKSPAKNFKSSGSERPAKKQKTDDDESGPASSNQPTNDSTHSHANDFQNSMNVFLTTVTGIGGTFNNRSWCRTLKNILAPDMGNLQSSVQFNYMFALPWLIEQYPSQFRDKPLLVVHGDKPTSASGQELREHALLYPNITLTMAHLPVAYGTHHTKMMLLFYDDGMRVVVHTSNLIPRDWSQKTQGMWISPLFPRVISGQPSPDSLFGFRADLTEYLKCYNLPKLNDVVNQLQNYDMSTANVCVVGSIPGRHISTKKNSFGHLKLRSLLASHCKQSGVTNEWPIIGQFSSIGSLGPTGESWLTGEFLESLSTPSVALTRKPHLNLIFPSVDNVRFSLEGWSGGGALPYSSATADKQKYLDKFLHVWKSESKGRTHAMPHVKTYTRVSPDLREAAWFLMTSANLSKAAWGALEKQSSQLMIRSYELGVLFLPKFNQCSGFTVAHDFDSPSTAVGKPSIFLPYDLPLEEYAQSDRPWTWDAPQTGLNDRFGEGRR